MARTHPSARTALCFNTTFSLLSFKKEKCFRDDLWDYSLLKVKLQHRHSLRANVKSRVEIVMQNNATRVDYIQNGGKCKGTAVPLQARRGPESSRKLRFPDFVTTAQDGDRLSALRAGRPNPKEILLVVISFRG